MCPTGCDPGYLSLVTGCAEEDKEVDKLGEEEDEEPPELYSGDVSSAVKRRRRPARGTSARGHTQSGPDRKQVGQ